MTELKEVNQEQLSEILEPANSQSLAYFQEFIGPESFQYLQETNHAIYCDKGEQLDKPSAFYIRDTERILQLEIRRSRDSVIEAKAHGKTVVHISFRFEKDFIAARKGEDSWDALNSFEANRKQLSGNTLSFLRFTFEVVRRINRPTVVIAADDDKRFDLYDKMLRKIGNPSNVLLTGD